MQLTTPLLTGLVALLLSSTASSQTPALAKPGNAVPTTSAPIAPQTRPVANQLLSAKLTSAQALAGAEVGGGNIIGFLLKGVGDPANPKCVVRVRFDRAPNAIFPQPYSFNKDYTLPDMNGQLETISPSAGGGDWIFQISALQNCTGGPFSFSRKVPFTPTDLEPKLHTLSGPGDQAFLQHGQTGVITIGGKGDLQSCQAELEISGPVQSPGKRMIAMNGKLSVQESFTVNFPPSNSAGFLPGSYQQVYLSLKPVSGCTLLNSVAAVNGKLTAQFKVWTSLLKQ